jgi:hypothetical protein
VSLISNIWLGLVFFNPVCHSMSFDWGIDDNLYSVLTLRGACCLQSIFIPFLFSFTCSLFIGLLGQKNFFFLASSCLTLVSSSVCKSPLSILCHVGLVVVNSFNFSLLWKVLASPTIRKDSFAE